MEEKNKKKKRKKRKKKIKKRKRKKKKKKQKKQKKKKKPKFFPLPLKTMGCFSGRLMSVASDQKLFCKLCSLFCCSFNEFVEEKVITPSYSSAILTPPLFLWVLPSGNQPDSHNSPQYILGEIPSYCWQGEGERNYFKMHQGTLSLTKSDFKRNHLTRASPAGV